MSLNHPWKVPAIVGDVPALQPAVEHLQDVQARTDEARRAAVTARDAIDEARRADRNAAVDAASAGTTPGRPKLPKAEERAREAREHADVIEEACRRARGAVVQAAQDAQADVLAAVEQERTDADAEARRLVEQLEAVLVRRDAAHAAVEYAQKLTTGAWVAYSPGATQQDYSVRGVTYTRADLMAALRADAAGTTTFPSAVQAGGEIHNAPPPRWLTA